MSFAWKNGNWHRCLLYHYVVFVSFAWNFGRLVIGSSAYYYNYYLFLCPLLGRMVIGISACYITLVLNCYCTIINVRHNPSINSLYASVEISNRSLFSGGGEALTLALFGHHQKDSTFRCPVA